MWFVEYCVVIFAIGYIAYECFRKGFECGKNAVIEKLVEEEIITAYYNDDTVTIIPGQGSLTTKRNKRK